MVHGVNGSMKGERKSTYSVETSLSLDIHFAAPAIAQSVVLTHYSGHCLELEDLPPAIYS